jgi:uncharacterized protein YjbJ (UPF0337 family)
MGQRYQFGHTPSMRQLALAVALGMSTTAAAACKSGNDNVADGKATETKGKVESAVGDVTGNDDKKADGQADQAKGKAQESVGKAQKKIDSAAKRVTSP